MLRSPVVEGTSFIYSVPRDGHLSDDIDDDVTANGFLSGGGRQMLRNTKSPDLAIYIGWNK